ncbi:MAG: type II secretion system protein GspD [Parachlamydiales bacterium]|nr:type II secretion system protein GspD [Parachlamydiales bacterium]
MRKLIWMFMAIPAILMAKNESDDLLLAEISLQKKKLQKAYEKIETLQASNADQDRYQLLLEKIKGRRKKIAKLEETWRQQVIENNAEEPAAWELGEVTLFQLVMQYGSGDYLYVIPPEIGGRKIHLFSSIPIPPSEWNEMIELILAENGIGIKKLSPILRQLFIAKHDPSSVTCVASSLESLIPFHSFDRVIYVFSPPSEQIHEILNFFERFSDPMMTAFHIVGNDIIIAATKQGVENLLSLYRAVWSDRKNKSVQVLPVKKGSPKEIKRVLEVFFQENQVKTRPSLYASKKNELFIMPLEERSSLILVGDSDQIEKAKEIVRDLENQLESTSEMMVYWYTCRYSDPEEVATILNKVYFSLVKTSSEKGMDVSLEKEKTFSPPLAEISKEKQANGEKKTFSPVLPVETSMVEPGSFSREKAETPTHNFIVDPKSGSILMVIRREDFPKIEHILQKIDVPQKMVQIDVLLIEKKIHDRQQSGINLLKIGSNSSDKKETSLSFDASSKSPKKGILDFILSRSSGKFPSFDVTLNFLLAQDDIRINANPTVLAVNQTPAKISIVEELSINNGAVQVDTNGVIEKSYTRAQYGIIIQMIPTIHVHDDETGFVTLQTDVTFDTTQTSEEDRPPVTRRYIKNEVRIADGETIILGGLRRQSEEDNREKIPFLGDIPGIGKLFGTTKLCTNSTEMFIFITPHIIHNDAEERKDTWEKEYAKRAGDLPEFLEKIEQAKLKKRKKLFENSLKLLFDL